MNKIDTIVPVPDGSRPAAIEIASALNLPYREGLVKNRYVGRTFIMPSQRVREMSVKRKLNAMSAVFKARFPHSLSTSHSPRLLVVTSVCLNAVGEERLAR